VRNGDFETPFFEDPLVTNSWIIGTNYTNSPSHLARAFGQWRAADGVQSRGSSLNLLVYQNLSPAPTNLQQCTLSFWFWATNQRRTSL
jgi:hypothetical protein